MYVPFENIADTSRIWIFQASRKLNPQQEEFILKKGSEFASQWTAHSQNLLASVTVLHNLFIIIAVDQHVNDASGCSIDKAFAFISRLEQDLGVTLLDRKNIAFEKNSTIEVASLNEFESAFKAGQLPEDVFIYNNLVNTKSELATRWRLPVKESWLMQLM